MSGETGPEVGRSGAATNKEHSGRRVGGWLLRVTGGEENPGEVEVELERKCYRNPQDLGKGWVKFMGKRLLGLSLFLSKVPEAPQPMSSLLPCALSSLVFAVFGAGEETNILFSETSQPVTGLYSQLWLSGSGVGLLSPRGCFWWQQGAGFRK